MASASRSVEEELGDTAPLLPAQPASKSSRKGGPTEAPRSRWWVLGVFVWLSTQQSLVWFTFASVPKAATYMMPNLTEQEQRDVLDLDLNFGPIVFLPMVVPLSWLLTKPASLKAAIVAGAWLDLCATVVRSIPCLLSASFRASEWTLVLMHTGQILNAIVGPIVLATPSRLSALWFPRSERTTATALAWLANGCGTALGYLLGPLLAPTAAQLPRLLFVEVLLSVVPVLCVSIYMPSRQQAAASAAAKARAGGAAVVVRQERTVNGVDGPGVGSGFEAETLGASQEYTGATTTMAARRRTTSIERVPADAGEAASIGVSGDQVAEQLVQLRAGAALAEQRRTGFVAGAVYALQSPSMWLLMIAFGLESGVSTAWGALLPQALSAANMTPDQAAVIGFANNVAGLVGSFGVGWTVDHYCPTRMKGVALGLSALAVAAYSWFTICLPSAVLPHQKPLLQPSLGMLVAAGSFGGFLQGGLDPLFYELAAELTYPVPEGTSGAILTFAFNLATLIVLLASPTIPFAWGNALMVAAMGGCLALVVFIGDKYYRSEAENRAASRS